MKKLKNSIRKDDIDPMESFIGRMNPIDDLTIRHYFSHTKYRGAHFNELKTQCINLLRKQGCTMEAIAHIVALKDHSCVVHHLYHKKKDNIIIDEVAKNFEDWLILGLYPESSGFKEYRLTKKSEFCGYLRK